MAVKLPEDANISFMGDTKQGNFDIDWSQAREMLSSPNPNGQPSSDVVVPWYNGRDITQRSRAMWIVDFPEHMSEADSSAYTAAFAYIEQAVKPWREENHKNWFRNQWWVHYAPRPDMKAALSGVVRFIVSPRVAKYRLFVWAPANAVPDCQLIAFARSDDYFFGVLHSSVHELWARRQGTQLREAESGFRYTPTTCFETFALPWAPGGEDFENPLVGAIGAAAAELNEQRERWLNPPEWLGPIAAAVDAEDDFADVEAVCGEAARALIRESAIMAAAASDAKLKKRTLTNLYNERPTWLKLAHRKLDEAVLAAYEAVDPAGGWAPAWAEAWEPAGAGQPLPADHPLAARREEIDQAVLANLLRLNRLRAGG
jgi:hypothetical protein